MELSKEGKVLLFAIWIGLAEGGRGLGCVCFDFDMLFFLGVGVKNIIHCLSHSFTLSVWCCAVLNRLAVFDLSTF